MYSRRNTRRAVSWFVVFIVLLFCYVGFRAVQANFAEKREISRVWDIASMLHGVCAEYYAKNGAVPSSLADKFRWGSIYDVFAEKSLSWYGFEPPVDTLANQIMVGSWKIIYKTDYVMGQRRYTISGSDESGSGQTIDWFSYPPE